MEKQVAIWKYPVVLEDNGQDLDVHHINYDKDNTTMENCIALCHACHMKTNHNWGYWQKHLVEIMSSRFKTHSIREGAK